PVFVPVSLRTPEEAVLPGNRLFPVRVDLPGGPAPAARRLADTARATAPLKSVSHRAVLRRCADALPTWLQLRLARRVQRPGLTSIGSSFLLMRHRLTVDGSRVTAVRPLMFCPEHTPLTVSLIAYAGTASVCFRIDRALPGAESLPARWACAVEELADPVGAPG
ncbi:WS/DGAT domain-containing protein, partial [Streptomyces clavuligerus]